jgi:hypothetical protein
MTSATFFNIRQQITKEIQSAKRTIQVAVAWFTSQELLDSLCLSLENGCNVELLISDHPENARLSFKRFARLGGKISIISSFSSRFLHDKFAVFDSSILLAGSYNWTNSAEYYNHEYIIASRETLLVKQFLTRFSLLEKFAVAYNLNLMQSSNSLCADTREEEFLLLEQELKKRFLATVEIANANGAGVRQKLVAGYFEAHGAVNGAARLISTGTQLMHSGLVKLFEIGRLDLSFESIIQEENFKRLFDRQTLEKAAERLELFNSKHYGEN